MAYKQQYKPKVKIRKIPDVINKDIGYFLITGWNPGAFNFLEKASTPCVYEYSIPPRQ